MKRLLCGLEDGTRQRETISVNEAVGLFGQEIPPMIPMKGKKHLHGWYYGEMPDHWTTAVSPNGWTDGYLGLQWFERNFESMLDWQKGTTNIDS